MNSFEYIAAHSVAEVTSLLSEDRKTHILSGGTDLIPLLKDGILSADVVVDVKSISDLRTLNFTEEDGLYLGAAVTCLQLRQNAVVKSRYPGLLDAVTIVGGIQIQGRASIGGNLCNSSPAADTIPALIVHRATCIIAGQSGTREVAVEQFCIGPGRNILNKELLVGINIPTPPSGFGAAYKRFIPRNEMDIAVVGVGVSLQVVSDKISNVRIALGAVAPTPLYLPGVGKVLEGIPVSDPDLETKIDETAKQAQEASSPISDMRGSAKQRKHLVEVITRRQIRRAIDRALEEQV